MNHGERGGAKPTAEAHPAREDLAQALSRLQHVGADVRSRRAAELSGLDKHVGALVEAYGFLVKAEQGWREEQALVEVRLTEAVQSNLSRLEEVSSERIAAEQAAERASRELESTRRELESVSKKLEAGLDDMTAAMLQHASAQERVATLTAELEEARNGALQSSAAVESAQVHVRALSEQLQQARIDLEALRQEQSELKDKASQSARKHHDELDALIDAHRDQLDLLAASQAAETARAAARERESQELIVALNKKVDEASRASLKLMQERDTVRKQVEELTAERDRQMLEACKKIATLTAQVADAQSALEQASSDALAGYMGETEGLRAQVRGLSLDLARAHEQSERLQAERVLADTARLKPPTAVSDACADADRIAKQESVTSPPPSRRASRKPPSSRSVQITAGPRAPTPPPAPAGSPGVYRMTAVDIRDETDASSSARRAETPTEPPRGAGKKRKR